MKPLTCPRCGASAGYFHRQPCRGVWESVVGPDGEVEATNLDDIHYGNEPRTVLCAACLKRVPNPNLLETTDAD